MPIVANLMERSLKYLILTAALVLCSIIVPAQTLPPLPTDDAIRMGQFANGVSYYMVTDHTRPGYAQIAVIQRGDPVTPAKREAISPQFLSRLGVGPTKEGFIQDRDGSTVYRFLDVPFYRPEAMDSVLLYSFAQMVPCHAPQAIVVCGDIDPVELKKKMDIFSMLVPRNPLPADTRGDYIWESNPAPSVIEEPGETTWIGVSYNSARVPYAQMNTALALVNDLFGAEFQVLLRHRLQRRFHEAGIPCGGIRFESLRSADYGGDERYTVKVQVPRDRVDNALLIMATTLGELDGLGVPAPEFAEAKEVIKPDILRGTQIPYTDRCIAHFLYGSNLAPAGERGKLFARKNLADSTEARLFSQYAQAMLEQLSNLTLSFQGADSLDLDDALFHYNLGYLLGSVSPRVPDYAWRTADTLGLAPAPARVKIKAEKAEAVTGGTLWTFSNGLRVVYKQVKGSGMFNYALLLNGGLSQIGKLQEGEGGYIGDLLSLYDVAGLSAWAFRDMLEGNGIGMQASVAINSMVISGDAPSAKLHLLLRSLLSVANDRQLNEQEFDLFCRSQALVQPTVEVQLGRYLANGFKYSTRKMPSALNPETLQKADKYFNDRFSRVNDGILILSGDLEEAAVRRHLSRYLGGFHVIRGATPRKPVEYRPYSGTTTVTGQGKPSGLHILLDAEYAFTAESFYTAQVAALRMKQVLIRHLASYGFSAQVDVDYRVQPQERYQLRITCVPVSKEADAYRALSAVRSAIKEAALTPALENDIQAWKALVLADTERTMSTAPGFVATLVARYAANKDITSRYAQSIEGISSVKVCDFLRSMASGGRIEYIIP